MFVRLKEQKSKFYKDGKSKSRDFWGFPMILGVKQHPNGSEHGVSLARMAAGGEVPADLKSVGGAQFRQIFGPGGHRGDDGEITSLI